MSDEVEPALSPDEWATWNDEDGHVVIPTTSPKLGYFVSVRHEPDGLAFHVIGPSPILPSSSMRTLMALCNDRLPPEQKITQIDVDVLRANIRKHPGINTSEELRLLALADVLEAYLPPREAKT